MLIILMSISVRKMREIEKKANAFGISSQMMMENAGSQAVRKVSEKTGLKGKKVLVFCGTGNNSGDGMVFARHALIQGAKISVFFVKGYKLLRSNEARKNFAILNSLKSLGFPVKFYEKVLPKLKPNVLVDAMLGTGINSKVRDDFEKAIRRFNSMRGYKISLDCPSGIESDTGKRLGIAVKPDITLTFYDRKKGLRPGNSGTIHVCHIGFPKLRGKK